MPGIDNEAIAQTAAENLKTKSGLGWRVKKNFDGKYTLEFHLFAGGIASDAVKNYTNRMQKAGVNFDCHFQTVPGGVGGSLKLVGAIANPLEIDALSKSIFVYPTIDEEIVMRAAKYLSEKTGLAWSAGRKDNKEWCVSGSMAQIKADNWQTAAMLFNEQLRNSGVEINPDRVIADGHGSTSGFFDINADYLNPLALLYLATHQAQINQTIISLYDPLTKLPNREFFNSTLLKSMTKTKNEKSKIFVFILDIDRFSEVNTVYGRTVGDKLLQIFAMRLKGATRKNDIVARRAGDQFLVYMEDISDASEVDDRAISLTNISNRPFKINELMIDVNISVGVSVFPIDSDNLDTLLTNASNALSEAKKIEGSSYVVYQSGKLSVEK